MNIRNDKTLMITSFMIILMLCCWGCYEDPLEDQGKEDLRPGQLTVEKAYDLFKEYAYNMDLGTRSIGESSSKVNLDPGVITPEWDHATLSTTRVNSFVNVPILVTNKYLVKSPYNEDWINVSQKLVVVQEDVTQRYNIYVLNLIPEGEFATKNGNDISDLCQAGQMPDDFSGLAVYTKMQGGLPVYVGSYRKGELVKDVFLFDNKYSFEENLDRINSLLRGYSLQTCNIALSRSYSESGGSSSGSSGSGDGWQFHTDGGSFQHDGYTCWYSSDGKGNRYIVADTNGDGKPDTIYGNVEDVVGGGGSGGTTNPGGGTINPGGGSTNPGGGGDINPGGGTTPGGGTGGNPPSQTILKNVELMDKDCFVGYDVSKSCMEGCKQIMAKYKVATGSSANVYQLLYERNGKLEYYDQKNYSTVYNNAINCINRHLDANRPIIVGVNHTLNKGINEGTTDHWIVVTGRGYDTGQKMYYYTYMETGRSQSNASGACSTTDNRLYYDSSNYSFKDAANYANKQLDVTQVRPNDGKNLNETIVQPQKPKNN